MSTASRVLFRPVTSCRVLPLLGEAGLAWPTKAPFSVSVPGVESPGKAGELSRVQVSPVKAFRGGDRLSKAGMEQIGSAAFVIASRSKSVTGRQCWSREGSVVCVME